LRVHISNQKFLVFAVVYAICAFAVSFLSPGILATVLLLPFFCFFPGYFFLSLLFPRKGSMGKLARISGSVGASIGLITLTGLAVALLPVGLNPAALAAGGLIVNIIFASASMLRNRRIPPEQRLCLSLLPGKRPNTPTEKFLTNVSVALVIVVLGAVIFSIILPPPGEQYTEFYLVPGNEAGKYAAPALAGQPVTVKIAVVNHLDQKQTYRIEARLNNKIISRENIPDLLPSQKLEVPLAVLVPDPGQNQKVEFFLYRAGEQSPLFKDALSLTLDITSAK
jgi:uncharacterized membrane protein